MFSKIVQGVSDPRDSKEKSMSPITKKSATLFILVFCVTVIATINLAKRYVAGLASGDSAAARVKGDSNAQVKIKEYIDFQCPACAKGSNLLSQYFQAYPGKVYLEIKYFPLEGMHQHAMRSARYAECAARQGKFWAYEELLIAQQPAWRELMSADLFFQQIARDVGLDAVQLEACLTNDTVKNTILAEKDLGTQQGVQSTPTYFINGKIVVGIKSLEEELKTLLGGLPSTQQSSAQQSFMQQP